MKVELHSEAEEEFIEQALFYEKQISNLGSSFIDEIESALSLLEKHSKIGAEFEAPYRNFPIRRFPHTLIYVIETDRIFVVAVSHQNRRPGYWRDRIN